MDFTFGIITGGNTTSRINKTIESIENEKIPNYEVIIVGGEEIVHDRVKHIPFDESIKSMWISRKKNIVSENASFENVVYMHDYVYLVPGWYNGHLKFGNDFQVLMDRILNVDGSRFRDWVVWNAPWQNQGRHIIPYDITHLSKYMYISGAYWVAKRDFMLENPIDESRGWNQGEDVEWSHRVRDKIDFKINIHSAVQFMKEKGLVFGFSTPEDHEKLKSTPPPSDLEVEQMRRGFYK